MVFIVTALTSVASHPGVAAFDQEGQRWGAPRVPKMVIRVPPRQAECHRSVYQPCMTRRASRIVSIHQIG